MAQIGSVRQAFFAGQTRILLGPPQQISPRVKAALPATVQCDALKWRNLWADESLARLWRDQGQSCEADDPLAPVYGWLMQSFHTLACKAPAPAAAI